VIRRVLVPASAPDTLPLGAYDAAIDERTLIVPISHVLFRSSAIKDVAAWCRSTGCVPGNQRHIHRAAVCIPRRPQMSPQLLQDAATQRSAPRLVPFPASQKVEPRDLALAWVLLVESGMSTDEAQERRLLFAALKHTPDDPALLSALGYLEQRRGATDQARGLYRKALGLAPESIDASANLGVIEARAGHVQEAVGLWQDAFKRAPHRGSIGMNIARVYCQAGKGDEAIVYVLRVLQFSPDRGQALKMLQGLGRSPATCRP